MAKTILIASGKGGTGKTSVSSYVGYALAEFGKKVLLIDTDCGFRGLDLTLGLTDKVVFNFLDVLNDNSLIDKAIIECNDNKNLHLLSAPTTNLSEEYTVSHIAKLINLVFDKYDFILIDCAAGLTYETTLFAKVSTACLVVTTPDKTSLRGAENMAINLENMGLTSCFLVLNRLRPKLILKNQANNIDEAIDQTALPLLGIVPEDENVICASNSGQVIFDFKKSKSAVAYKNIAQRLCGKQVNIINL